MDFPRDPFPFFFLLFSNHSISWILCSRHNPTHHHGRYLRRGFVSYFFVYYFCRHLRCFRVFLFDACALMVPLMGLACLVPCSFFKWLVALPPLPFRFFPSPWLSCLALFRSHACDLQPCRRRFFTFSADRAIACPPSLCLPWTRRPQSSPPPPFPLSLRVPRCLSLFLN